MMKKNYVTGNILIKAVFTNIHQITKVVRKKQKNNNNNIDTSTMCNECLCFFLVCIRIYS